MSKARQEVELAVRLGSETGALGKVLAVVAEVKVDVLAYCSYSDRHETIVLLVTDNALLAKRALETAGYVCRANSVVIVGAADRVGGAALLGARLGYAGIDILYSYASSSGETEFCAVFKTSDDQRALSVLDSAAAVRAA